MPSCDSRELLRNISQQARSSEDELTFTGLCCESFYSRKAAFSSRPSPPEDRLVEDRVRVNCSASFWLMFVIWLSWERPGLWADPASVTSFGSNTFAHLFLPSLTLRFSISNLCRVVWTPVFLSCFFSDQLTHNILLPYDKKLLLIAELKKTFNSVTFDTHFLQTRDRTVYDFIADRDRKTLRESWSSWIYTLGIKAVTVSDFHYRSWPNTFTIVI